MSLNVFTAGMQGLTLTKHRMYAKATSETINLAKSLQPDSIVAASLTHVGTLATFTANAAHHLSNNQFVNVSGSDQAEYNIQAQITVTGATTFTYVMLSNPAADSGGSPIADYVAQAQLCFIQSDPGNADVINFGPDINANFRSLAVGETYQIPIAADCKFNMAEWYVASPTASQNLNVLFV